MKGSSMWVCGSMPPGITSAPPASTRTGVGRGLQVQTDGLDLAAHAKHVGAHAGLGVDHRSALESIRCSWFVPSIQLRPAPASRGSCRRSAALGHGQHRLDSTFAPASSIRASHLSNLVVADAADAGHEDHRGAADLGHVSRRRGPPETMLALRVAQPYCAPARTSIDTQLSFRNAPQSSTGRSAFRSCSRTPELGDARHGPSRQLRYPSGSLVCLASSPPSKNHLARITLRRIGREVLLISPGRRPAVHGASRSR